MPKPDAGGRGAAAAAAAGAREAHEKIVDLDNDKEFQPPPDAKYLAQKNNRAEKRPAPGHNLETHSRASRAASTSL